jgi:hypothetical protein
MFPTDVLSQPKTPENPAFDDQPEYIAAPVRDTTNPGVDYRPWKSSNVKTG